MSGLWNLPAHWQWSTMGQIAEIVGGGTPSTKLASNFEGDIPWITPADLSGYQEKCISFGKRNISVAALNASGATWLPKGAVLFSSRAPIGYTAIAAEPVTTNQGFKSFIPQQGIASDFIYYWLSSAKQLAEDLASGTTFLEISGAKAGMIPVPVAPAAEQTRIVAKIEELLTDLDAGVAELKAAQKKLAQYRQSLLKAAVDGSLTAEWRDQNTPTETGAQLLTRILQERRARWEAKQRAKFEAQGKAPPKDWQKKYPEPVQPDTNDLPVLPQGWVWATIDQIAQVGTGVTPLRSKSAYFVDGTIPWVTSGALNADTVAIAAEHVTELALKECRLEVFPVGSLLVAMYGEGKTRGKCAELLIPATINQAIAAIVLDPAAQSCKAYLKAFLLGSYEGMRAQASGGVQPNLNLQIVKSIALPLPPQAEQTAITLFLNDQFDQLALQQAAVELAFKQSSAQRQNILRAAFSGQLVPQDLGDEPASVLLARVRNERANIEKLPKPRRSKQQKENAPVTKKMKEVLAEAKGWISAQDAFQRCGIEDGATTDQVEALYAELRDLHKANSLVVGAVTDKQGRKSHDQLKLVEG